MVVEWKDLFLKTLLRFAVVVGLCWWVTVLGAAVDVSAVLSDFDRVVEQAHTDFEVPVIAIAVAKDGEAIAASWFCRTKRRGRLFRR